MYLPSYSTCHKLFREALFEVLPILRYNKPYLDFVIYLLFGDYYDDDGRGLLISTEVLATLEGKHKQYQNHRYSGLPFLEEIQAHVLPDLTWSQHTYDPNGGPGKARVILNNGLPESLVARARAERELYDTAERRIVINSGAAYNRARKAQWRSEQQAAALASATAIELPELRNLLTYMNSRSGNLFTSLQENAQIGYDILRSIQKSTPKETEAFWHRQCNALRRFQEQPQPFYARSAKGHSTRIFSINGGLLNLKSAVRKGMTRANHWPEYDLKSVHLAVAAKDWQVPIVYDYLRDRIDLWGMLLDHLGLPYTPEWKALIKPPLYSVPYGASRWWIEREVTERLGRAGAGKRFCSHPIIEALFDRRDHMKNLVIAQGGMTDCFGRWLALNDMVSSKPEKQAFSILSICAQARELELLTPVINEAIRLGQGGAAWQIILFQHDGFTVALRDWSPDRVRSLSRRLQSLVQARADALDIPTWLECEDN